MGYKLDVKILMEGAKAPSVANPGEDIGYDLYAAEDITLVPMALVKVKTGIAVRAYDRVKATASFIGPGTLIENPLGLLIRDRSSMASKGIFTHGGVIDAGYRGEIIVLMTALKPESVEWGFNHFGEYSTERPYQIRKGDKIAQMIPVPVMTGEVSVIEEFEETSRGGNGFGSSGR